MQESQTLREVLSKSSPFAVSTDRAESVGLDDIKKHFYILTNIDRR